MLSLLNFSFDKVFILKEPWQFNSLFGVFPLGGKDASVWGIATFSFCKEDSNQVN